MKKPKEKNSILHSYFQSEDYWKDTLRITYSPFKALILSFSVAVSYHVTVAFSETDKYNNLQMFMLFG